MDQLQKDKYEERLDYAIELLNKKFPGITKTELIKQASDTAMGLYVRSEINFATKH